MYIPKLSYKEVVALAVVGMLAVMLCGCDCGPTREEVSQIKDPQWREIWHLDRARDGEP